MLSKMFSFDLNETLESLAQNESRIPTRILLTLRGKLLKNSEASCFFVKNSDHIVELYRALHDFIILSFKNVTRKTKSFKNSTLNEIRILVV